MHVQFWRARPPHVYRLALPDSARCAGGDGAARRPYKYADAMSATSAVGAISAMSAVSDRILDLWIVG